MAGDPGPSEVPDAPSVPPVSEVEVVLQPVDVPLLLQQAERLTAASLPDNMPEEVRAEIDAAFAPNAQDAAWVRALHASHDPTAVLEAAQAHPSKISREIDEVIETGPEAVDQEIQRLLDLAQQYSAPIETPGAEYNMKWVSGNWASFNRLVRPGESTESSFYRETVSKWAVPFLIWLMEHTKGNYAQYVKASTVKKWTTNINAMIGKFTIDPANDNRRCGIILLRSGLWRALDTAGRNFVFERGLDRRREPPVYYGRWELKTLIEYSLSSSESAGPMREACIQIVVAWLIALYTGTRCGALAASYAKYLLLGLFLKWGDISLRKREDGNWECYLTLANMKGFNLTWDARQTDFLLGPVRFPENIIFDLPMWILLFAFRSGQLDPAFKTFEDVLDADVRELEFLHPEKSVFVQGTKGGRGLNYDKAALSSTIHFKTYAAVKACRLTRGSIHSFRRDTADAYSRQIGPEAGPLTLVHGDGGPGAMFAMKYSRGLSGYDLVAIRLMEVESFNTVAERMRAQLYLLESPAVKAWVYMWLHGTGQGSGKEIRTYIDNAADGDQLIQSSRPPTQYVPISNEDRSRPPPVQLRPEYIARFDSEDAVVSMRNTVRNAAKALQKAIPLDLINKSTIRLRDMKDTAFLEKLTVNAIVTNGLPLAQTSAAKLALEEAQELCNQAFALRTNVNKEYMRRYRSLQEDDDLRQVKQAAKSAPASLYASAAEQVQKKSKILEALQRDIGETSSAEHSAPPANPATSVVIAELEYNEDSSDDEVDANAESARVQKIGRALKGKGKASDRDGRDADEIFNDKEVVPLELDTDVPANTGIPLTETSRLRRAFILAVDEPIRRHIADEAFKAANGGLLVCERCEKFVPRERASTERFISRSAVTDHDRNFHTPWKDRAMYVIKEEAEDGTERWKCPFQHCVGFRNGYASYVDLSTHFVDGSCAEHQFWVLILEYSQTNQGGRFAIRARLDALSTPATKEARNLAAIRNCGIASDARLNLLEEFAPAAVRERLQRHLDSCVALADPKRTTKPFAWQTELVDYRRQRRAAAHADISTLEEDSSGAFLKRAILPSTLKLADTHAIEDRQLRMDEVLQLMKECDEELKAAAMKREQTRALLKEEAEVLDRIAKLREKT